MWRRDEQPAQEDWRRWGVSRGRERGGAQQKETQEKPHHLHHLPASRAGASLREVPLSRCVQPRGAGDEGQPAWSTSAGTVQDWVLLLSLHYCSPIIDTCLSCPVLSSLRNQPSAAGSPSCQPCSAQSFFPLKVSPYYCRMESCCMFRVEAEWSSTSGPNLH